jgi:hypothetical protein
VVNVLGDGPALDTVPALITSHVRYVGVRPGHKRPELFEGNLDRLRGNRAIWGSLDAPSTIARTARFPNPIAQESTALALEPAPPVAIRARHELRLVIDAPWRLDLLEHRAPSSRVADRAEPSTGADNG